MSFPQELAFPTPSTMVESRTFAQRIQPYNATTATAAGQTFQFRTGKMAKSVLQNQTATISGRCTIPKHNTGVSGTDNSVLCGSAYSLFRRQITNSNGTLVDDVNDIPSLAHKLLCATANSAELSGMTNIGATGTLFSIHSTPGDTDIVFDFCLPLMGIINGASGYTPLAAADLEFQFEVSDVLSYVLCKTAKKPTSFTISNVLLNYNVLEMSDATYAEWVQTAAPNGVVNMLSSSYAFTGSSLLSGGAGQQTVAYPHSYKSVKNVFISCGGAEQGPLTSINPNLGRYPTLNVGSNVYPQNMVDIKNTATAVSEIFKNFGSLYSSSHSSSYRKANFNVAASANYSGTLYAAPWTTGNAFTSSNNSNMFAMAIDLEKMSGDKGGSGMYNGVDTIGVTSSIDFNIDADIGGGGSRPLSIHSHYDCIVKFDLVNGTVSVSH